MILMFCLLLPDCNEIQTKSSTDCGGERTVGAGECDIVNSVFYFISGLEFQFSLNDVENVIFPHCTVSRGKETWRHSTVLHWY